MSLPVDARMALDSAMQQDPVQKKIAIDSLRKRLGDSRTEDERLQEACEGFEAIFIQKMWEQMRKNVNKEGYLHSKDEETYQSMFDQELAKKMTSAGGIGLAAMLKEQLSRQLTSASRTTASSGIQPIPIGTVRESLLAGQSRGEVVEDLYTPVEEETGPAEASEEAPDMVLQKALRELEDETRAALEMPEELVAVGPVISSPAHYVAPGAEPRSMPVTQISGKVRAPGKGLPSQSRVRSRALQSKAVSAQPELAAQSAQAGSAEAPFRSGSPSAGAQAYGQAAEAEPSRSAFPSAAAPERAAAQAALPDPQTGGASFSPQAAARFYPSGGARLNSQGGIDLNA